jgi:hypothetical protein
MARRFLLLLGILFTLAGTGVFVFVAVKVWHVKADVNRQARYLVAKAHSAADAADRAIGFVREILAKAKSDLALARVRPGSEASGPVSPILQITAMQASRELLGSVERAQGAVQAASNAVVVADAALDVAAAGDYPELDKLFGLSPEHLKQSRSALVSISGELTSARGIIGVTPDSMTVDQLNAVNAALEQANDLTNRLSDVVKMTRGRVNGAKVEVDLWASRLAFAVTALAVVAALGQLFVLRFCMRKLMHLPA